MTKSWSYIVFGVAPPVQIAEARMTVVAIDYPAFCPGCVFSSARTVVRRGAWPVRSLMSPVPGSFAARCAILYTIARFRRRSKPYIHNSFLGEPALLVYNHGLVAVRWLSARIAAERVLPTKPSVDGSVPARSRCLEAPY